MAVHDGGTLWQYMMVGSTPSSLFVHYASFYKVSPLGRMPPARSCPYYIQSVSTISGVHPSVYRPPSQMHRGPGRTG